MPLPNSHCLYYTYLERKMKRTRGKNINHGKNCIQNGRAKSQPFWWWTICFCLCDFFPEQYTHIENITKKKTLFGLKKRNSKTRVYGNGDDEQQEKKIVEIISICAFVYDTITVRVVQIRHSTADAPKILFLAVYFRFFFSEPKKHANKNDEMISYNTYTNLIIVILFYSIMLIHLNYVTLYQSTAIWHCDAHTAANWTRLPGNL